MTASDKRIERPQAQRRSARSDAGSAGLDGRFLQVKHD